MFLSSDMFIVINDKFKRQGDAATWRRGMTGRNGKELREEVGYRDAPASRTKDAHG